MLFLKIYQDRYIHRLCANESPLSFLFFFSIVRESISTFHLQSHDQSNCSEIFKKSQKTYSDLFVKIFQRTLRALTHCNITDISLNRMP